MSSSGTNRIFNYTVMVCCQLGNKPLSEHWQHQAGLKNLKAMEMYANMAHMQYHQNKANLRDLIAATSLVILLEIGFKSSFMRSMWPSNLIQIIHFSACTRDLNILWMTSKNNRTPLPYYIKLCASFQTHWWIQTAVTVQKCSIWGKIGDFLSCVTLKFDGWPWQTIGHLFYATSSFVNHFKAIGEFKLEWHSGNTQFRSKSAIFVP